jgi:YVTN family beta-propeller protein
VAVSPSGDYVYVTNNSDNTVSVIRTSDSTVTATIGVGQGPWGVDITNSGDNVYVVNNSDSTVSVIRTSDNTVTVTINVGNSPVGLGKFIGGTVPEAPSNIIATAVSTSQIDLSWTDNSDDEFGFKIERKRYGETFSQIDTVSANVTSYSDTELSTYSTYYYRVRAYNNAGNSNYSNETYATTEEEESGCFIATALNGSP